MPPWTWLVAGLLAMLLAAGLYWLLVLTEGAYLGPKAVVALYNRFAPRYDRIKQFDREDEAYFLGQPLARILAEAQGATGRQPVILDVATGTGRYPLAVLPALQGRGTIVALDRAQAMLQQAQQNLAAWPQVIYVCHAAMPLPFAGDSFDAVACLEALEFLPHPAAELGELLRVLRPGGLLVISNRIGWQARLMPGKVFSRTGLGEVLRDLGATAVQITPWQVDYDLVMALKPGWPAEQTGGDVATGRVLRGLLQCPACGQRDWRSTADDRQVVCDSCGWQLSQRDGIWRAAAGRARQD